MKLWEGAGGAGGGTADDSDCGMQWLWVNPKSQARSLDFPGSRPRPVGRGSVKALLCRAGFVNRLFHRRPPEGRGSPTLGPARRVTG